MISDLYSHSLVPPSMSLRNGIDRMNEHGLQILFVVDDGTRLMGTVTDGDIRRAIARGVALSTPLPDVMNPHPTVARENDPQQLRALMADGHIRQVPLVDDAGRVVDVADWSALLRPAAERPHRDIPVVIMAGGEGTRLRPITRVLPKPLVPIGGKTLIERVMDSFHKHGFDAFWLTVNYKREVIRQYFDGLPMPYQVSFLEEESFLGTAGALALAAPHLNGTFVVSNCDIILDADFDALIRFHREHGAEATVLSVLQRVQIPYGVLEVSGVEVTGFDEKPSYDFMINSGVYVLEAEALAHLPPQQRYDMPDLLMAIRAAGGMVASFPYVGKWFDVGQWDQYQKAIDYLQSK